MGSVRGVYRYVQGLGLRIGVLGPQGLRSSNNGEPSGKGYAKCKEDWACMCHSLNS